MALRDQIGCARCHDSMRPFPPALQDQPLQPQPVLVRLQPVRWLLPLVTPLVACKEAVGDGVAGGGKPAASATSSSKDIDGVTSALLRLPLVPLPVLSMLPSLSRDRTGKT